MAVLPHRTHTQILPHLVRTGTGITDASLLWDRMVLMGRIQHLIHPTHSCMGSKTRTLEPTEQVALLVLWPAQEQWEFTTTRFNGLMSMMGMVESDEDSGPPSVAEGELGPNTFLISCHMPPCCSSLSLIIHVHYRHLLIPIHVDDCYTTSLTFGFFRSPHSGYPIRHAWSNRQYIRLVSRFRCVVKTIACHSLFPLSPSCPLISIFLRSFGATSYRCHPSHFSFIALFSPSRNCSVLYLLHSRWHTGLLSTIYLIDNNVTHLLIRFGVRLMTISNRRWL